MKRFLLLIVLSLYSFIAAAHKGHGDPNLIGWMHYLLELVHGFWIIVPIVVFLIYRFLSDDAASNRTE